MNAVEIEEAVSELVQQPFDPEEFPFQFLTAFGAKDTTLKRLRKGESNTSDVPGGILQRNNIHIAVAPQREAGATLNALRSSPKTSAARAKFILATDGETVEAEDLLSGDVVACPYAETARFTSPRSCRSPAFPPLRSSRTTPSTLKRQGGLTAFMSSC